MNNQLDEILSRACSTLNDAARYRNSMLLSSPPQEAWLVHGMDRRIREAQDELLDLKELIADMMVIIRAHKDLCEAASVIDRTDYQGNLVICKDLLDRLDKIGAEDVQNRIF